MPSRTADGGRRRIGERGGLRTNSRARRSPGACSRDLWAGCRSHSSSVSQRYLGRRVYLASPPVVMRWCWTVRSTSGADSYRSTSWVVHVVAGELADFAPVGQSAFCQGWQLCVKNAASLGWIITTSGPVLMLLSMMWVSLRLFSLA